MFLFAYTISLYSQMYDSLTVQYIIVTVSLLTSTNAAKGLKNKNVIHNNEKFLDVSTEIKMLGLLSSAAD